MHTEHSYSNRKFDFDVIAEFPALVAAHRDFVLQLWRSVEWVVCQFADFVTALTEDEAPAVIEIHPSFTDYTDMAGFVESYKRQRIAIPLLVAFIYRATRM